MLVEFYYISDHGTWFLGFFKTNESLAELETLGCGLWSQIKKILDLSNFNAFMFL